MRSMSGYGSGAACRGAARVTVEVRAVNHRHLEVRVAAPPGAAGAAAVVESRIRKRFSRGRIDAAVAVEGGDDSGARSDAVEAAYVALDGIRKRLGAGDPIDIGALYAAVAAGRPGAPAGPDAQEAAQEAADAAIDQVTAMREREGRELRDLLAAALQRIETLVGSLEERAASLRAALPERVRARADAALRAVAAGTMDPDRLAAEVAIAVDRADVSEEIGRLRCHVDHLRSLLDSDAPVGRRADFLVQEILRENGTTAAKAQDASVSATAAELRSLAEQVREQLQNVE